MTRLAVLLGLFLVLLSPSQAFGGVQDGRPDSQALEELRLAQRFWQDRGWAPKQVSIRFEDLPEGVLGQGELGGTELHVDRHTARLARYAHNPYVREEAIRSEAQIIFHEYGHNLGWLPSRDQADYSDPIKLDAPFTLNGVHYEAGDTLYVHSEHGLMQAGQWDDSFPYAVKVYARHVMREKRRYLHGV